MRVAFDVGPVRAQGAGVGVFALAMAHALAAELAPADLALVGARPEMNDLPTGPRRILRPAIPYLPWLQLIAARDVRRAGADVAHFSDGAIPPFNTTPTVVSIHDLSIIRTWRSHPRRRLLRVPLAIAAARRARLIVVPSRATADEVVRLTGASQRKIAVVPYAPQVPMAPPAPSETTSTLAEYGLEQGTYVLGLGTIEPRKNHLGLVEGFEIATRTGGLPADTQLVIIGRPGWGSSAIIARMAASPVASRIRRLGYVPADRLPALLAGAAAVVYPSFYEGFGLPVIEALACGAPTVTSNISSMPEVAGEAAFLVDPSDPSDIARGIEVAVRAGADDRDAISRSGIAQAANFSWSRTAATVIDLYRKLV